MARRRVRRIHDDWPARPGFVDFLKWTLGGRPCARGTSARRTAERRRALARQPRARVDHLDRPRHGADPGGRGVGAHRSHFGDDIGGLFRRFAPPGVALAQLPPIDVVVISHNHRDHLDEESVRAMSALAPRALRRAARHRRLVQAARPLERDRARLVAVDGGARPRRRARDGEPGAGAALVAARGPDRNWSLWGGYVIDAGGTRFYFAGDTGYPAAFDEVGRRFPGSISRVCRSAPTSRAGSCTRSTCRPRTRRSRFAELGARALVPIHWATFQLSDEPMDEPPALLYRAMGVRGAPIAFCSCRSADLISRPRLRARADRRRGSADRTSPTPRHGWRAAPGPRRAAADQHVGDAPVVGAALGAGDHRVISPATRSRDSNRAIIGKRGRVRWLRALWSD